MLHQQSKLRIVLFLVLFAFIFISFLLCQYICEFSISCRIFYIYISSLVCPITSMVEGMKPIWPEMYKVESTWTACIWIDLTLRWSNNIYHDSEILWKCTRWGPLKLPEIFKSANIALEFLMVQKCLYQSLFRCWLFGIDK